VREMARILVVALVVLAAPPAAATDGEATDGDPTGGEAPGTDAPDPSRPAFDPATYKLELASPDRSFSVRIGLTAQVWLVVGGVGDAPETQVALRRVRPTLSGTAFTPKFRYLFHVGFLPGDVEFFDMMGDLRLAQGFHVRVGVWKIPFTRYRIRSYKDRSLVDWANVSQIFGGERQAGICLHSDYDAAVPPRFEWALGVFSGINTRDRHAIGVSKLYGIDLDEIDQPGYAHPEVVARVGLNLGGIDTKAEADLEGGPFRLALSLGGAWDLNPVWGRDWAIRGAFEALMKVRGYSLAGTFYLATIEDGETPADQRLSALGVFATTGYVFHRRLGVSLQYSAILPQHRGAVQHEGRGGVAVYILKRRVQLRADGGVVVDRVEPEPRTDVQIRGILQMSL